MGAYETYIKPENQAHIQINLVKKAFDGDGDKVKGAYNAGSAAIDKEYGGKVSFKGDAGKAKIRRVLTEYMKSFFQVHSPGVLDAVKGLSEEEAYKTLATYFDREVAAGQDIGQGIKPQQLSGLDERIQELFVDEHGEAKEVTKEELKAHLSQWAAAHKLGAKATIDSHAENNYIAPLSHGVYAQSMIERMGKLGYKIKDKKKAELLRKSNQEIGRELHHPLASGASVDYVKHGFYKEPSKN